MGSTDAFADTVALCLLSASLVPSDFQGRERKRERGKQEGGLFAQQHWAWGMLQLHSTSLPRCLLLSPGGKKAAS